MPITLDLTEEVVARLQAEAVRRRLSLDGLVAQLVGSLPGEGAVPSDGSTSDGTSAPGDVGPENLRQPAGPMSLRALARLPLDERLDVLGKANFLDRMDGMEAWEALPWNEPA